MMIFHVVVVVVVPFHSVINGDCQLASKHHPRDTTARDLRTNSRSPPLSYAYWHLHLRPILLRFPRGTRARNSFHLDDRVLGLSCAVSALIYHSVRQDGIRKREILIAALEIMPGERISSSSSSSLLQQ